MAERVLSKSNRKTVTQYKAELAYIFAEMAQLESEMDKDRAEGSIVETNIKMGQWCFLWVVC